MSENRRVDELDVQDDPMLDPVDAETAEDIPALTGELSDVTSGPSEYTQSEGGRAGRGNSELRPDDIDYKNVTQVARFLDRRGRILSRRKTRVSAKVQRRIAQAVKRARHLALLPYTADQTRIVRKRR
jgi:small subunit ribosomal protein S18